jgi:D-sedoheptulose 7-phosphate isomerase
MNLDSIRQYLEEVQCTLAALPLERIQDVADVLLKANDEGSTVFTLGNGGSAATASHFACDLAKGTITPGRPRFRVMALTDNVPLMSAWSNDVAYEDVFAEQLRGLIRPRDVVVAFSGSGNSSNVMRAVELARRAGGITIGFSGFGGGKLSTMVDVSVVAPNDCMEQIEDVHVVLCHLLATVLRERLLAMEPSESPVWDEVESGEEREFVAVSPPCMGS